MCRVQLLFELAERPLLLSGIRRSNPKSRQVPAVRSRILQYVRWEVTWMLHMVTCLWMNFSSPVLHSGKLFHAFFLGFSFPSLFFFFLVFLFFFLFYFFLLFFLPSTPTPRYSNSHFGQERRLKSKFLWQSVLSERLWVTVAGQQNLHHKSPKVHVSRCATAFVVLQTSLQLTSIISLALFSVPCRSFNMKEEGLHVSKFFKKNLPWLYEAQVSEM